MLIKIKIWNLFKQKINNNILRNKYIILYIGILEL